MPAPTSAPAVLLNFDDWVPHPLVQPPLPKGEKVTKNIGGIDITLPRGHRYSMAIPGNAGNVLMHAEDEVGVKQRAAIYIVSEGRGGKWEREQNVLYLSLHPQQYKQVQANFPSGMAW